MSILKNGSNSRAISVQLSIFGSIICKDRNNKIVLPKKLFTEKKVSNEPRVKRRSMFLEESLVRKV